MKVQIVSGDSETTNLELYVKDKDREGLWNLCQLSCLTDAPIKIVNNRVDFKDKKEYWGIEINVRLYKSTLVKRKKI